MYKKLSFTTVLSLLFISAIALAAPGIPNRFHGYVNFINGPAPDGLIVEAKIDGTTVASIATSGGKYGFAPDVFDVTDTDNNRNGKTISFFVGGVDTGKIANFTNGDSDELNFSINGYVNEISKDKIENENITVAPNSPARISLSNDMNITLSSSSAGIVSIRNVEKLSNSFYTGSYAVLSGKNVLNGYEINIVGNVNITAIMKYSDSGIDENTVMPYKFSNGVWNELPILLYRDTAANTITFIIPSAQTPYAIFASPIQTISPAPSTDGTTETPSVTPTSCTPNWSCSAWSSCVNGLQTRSCTDSNICGTTQNRPALSQSCPEESAPSATLPVIETNTSSAGNDMPVAASSAPTGMFLGLGDATWAGIIVTAVAVLLAYLFKKGKLKMPSKSGFRYSYKQ